MRLLYLAMHYLRSLAGVIVPEHFQLLDSVPVNAAPGERWAGP